MESESAVYLIFTLSQVTKTNVSHVFCIHLEVRTVHVAMPWFLFSHDAIYFQPEIMFHPQSADIASFCHSALNGPTFSRETVSPSVSRACESSDDPSCHPSAAVMRHVVCNIWKIDKTRLSFRMSNKNVFILSGKTSVLRGLWQTSEHVSVTPPQSSTRYPNNVSRTFSLGSLVRPAPTEGPSQRVIMPVGKKTR